MSKNLRLFALAGSVVSGTILCSSMIAVSSGVSNNDHYRIEYTGTPGNRLNGSYAIEYPIQSGHRLTKVQEISSYLPHSVEFNAPKKITVIAVARSGGITVRIFKNGVECGKTNVSSFYRLCE